MNNKVVLMGQIEFEPENITKKHNTQSPWKRIAMVKLDGDICEYYSWFIERRFSVKLNKPIRGAHVSFINDSLRDFKRNEDKTNEEIDVLWNRVKNKWDGVRLPIMLDLNPKFNDKHCWFNIPHEYRGKLQSIRDELGLGYPYYGLHLSLGYVNDKQLPHLKYIHSLIKSGLIK